MTDNSTTPTVAAGDAAEPEPFDFERASRDVARTQRKEMAAKVRELRRGADGTKERAKRAQARFERAVALLASDKPEREDWYEHPGAMPRKALLEASGLNTMGLHRIMERYRKTRTTKTTKPTTTRTRRTK